MLFAALFQAQIKKSWLQQLLFPFSKLGSFKSLTKETPEKKRSCKHTSSQRNTNCLRGVDGAVKDKQ
jgi:hypothetical protein